MVVTKHGRPFIELVAVQHTPGMDFARAALVHQALGVDGLSIGLPPDLDDPAFSRQALGLPD